MKQFTRTALAGIVALAGIAFVGGCQRSGSTDTTARSDSGMSAEVTTTTGRFDQAYEATRDTEWVSSTAADAERGTLMRGDRVMFDRAPGTADWQEARTTTGRTVYVRPGDFRRAS
jgi:hypothetical protein